MEPAPRLQKGGVRMKTAIERTRSTMLATMVVVSALAGAFLVTGASATPLGNEDCWDEITPQGWQCESGGCDSQTSDCCENCEQ